MYANDDYILLLSKQFSGEITPVEAAALNDWLTQSPENERLAAELRTVWEKTGGYGKAFSPDLDAAFRQVQAKIKMAERPRAKVVPLGQRLMRAAAVLLFLLAAVWGYREFSAPPLTKILAENEKRLVELPDGSRVWLRKGSEMEFPSKFSSSERRIKLSGEAYFEVAPNPVQPFLVNLPNGDAVKVLGTEFGVRSSENQTDIFVRSGKVFFAPKLQPKGVVLTARQKATFNRNAPQLTVEENATLNELAWQTGGLEFLSTPMEEVVGDLERHFNVKISLRNPAMRSCAHTSPLTTQPLEKVLENLALTYQFRVTSPAPGQYELTGGVCQ
jgi:ferric-dicitrate binding protein FerR (iron transport regulator)